MPSPLESSTFVRLLDKRLNEVAEDAYGDLPGMIQKLYNVESSESAWEEYMSISGLGDIPAFTGRLNYLSMSPGYLNRIEHREYAAGVVIERKLIDDKKYAVMENMASALAKATNRTQEKDGAKTFQYAFSSAFDFLYTEEGVSLCSNSHTSKSGASTAVGFDNLGTTALSKTAIAAARIAMQQFRNDMGERIDMDDSWALVVPLALEDTAREIADTKMGFEASTTSANKANTEYGRFEVIPYLRLDDVDTNNWFLVNKTLMAQQLMWFNRIKPEFKNTVDFETFQIKHSVYARWSCGWKDWRWVYGSQVS